MSPDIVNTLLYFIFFFFSSRRRHTRLTCDWSSDVCSSDLTISDSSRVLNMTAIDPIPSPFSSSISCHGFSPPRGSISSRSEEHTSELQSHVNLVCRLLLEKKKKKQ